VFIPVGFNLPFFRLPQVTLGLIVVTGFLFFFLTLPEFTNTQNVSETWTYRASLLPSESNPWWAYFSYAFLHASPFHWLFNIWYLAIFGWVLESAWGSGRFVLFYLGAAALSVVPEMFIRMNESMPIVGASGAVAACMGGVFLLYPDAKVRLWFGMFPMPNFPATFFVSFRLLCAIWLAMQISGYASHLWIESNKVAYATHLTGFALGALVALLVRRYRKPFLDIELSGRDLETVYQSMEAYAKEETTKANLALREVAQANRVFPNAQERLFEISLRMRQQELSKQILTENYLLLRSASLEKWRSRYLEVYGEEAPLFDSRQQSAHQIK
jgi:membrane associated rhomboid family serine protease